MAMDPRHPTGRTASMPMRTVSLARMACADDRPDGSRPLVLRAGKVLTKKSFGPCTQSGDAKAAMALPVGPTKFRALQLVQRRMARPVSAWMPYGITGRASVDLSPGITEDVNSMPLPPRSGSGVYGR